MNTKNVLYLSHDPGGYDVIAPLVQQAVKARKEYEFYCIGPAATLAPEYAAAKESVLGRIKQGLAEDRFQALVTGTSWGNTVELEAIRLFRLKGLPTISILDYWSNYTQRFELGIERHIYPDYLIVMDQLAKGEAIQAGVPEAIIHELGHPGLDRIIEMRIQRRSRQLRKKQKVLFLSQPLSQLYGQSLGYTEKEVLEDCLTMAALYNISIHVKFHPKDDPEFVETYRKLVVSGNLTGLFSSYDLVIGMSTMGLLHAVLMGIPAVSYQPNLCVTDEAITNKLGLTPCLTSKKELILYMKSFQLMDSMPDRNIESFMWTDGKSTSRVMAFIEGVLAG